jgi:hypothetical protein
MESSAAARRWLTGDGFSWASASAHSFEPPVATSGLSSRRNRGGLSAGTTLADWWSSMSSSGAQPPTATEKGVSAAVSCSQAHGAKRPVARSNRRRGTALTKLRRGELDDGPTAWHFGRRCSDRRRGGFWHDGSDRGFLYGQTTAWRHRPARPIRTRRGPTQAMTGGAHASARIQF